MILSEGKCTLMQLDKFEFFELLGVLGTCMGIWMAQHTFVTWLDAHLSYEGHGLTFNKIGQVDVLCCDPMWSQAWSQWYDYACAVGSWNGCSIELFAPNRTSVHLESFWHFRCVADMYGHWFKHVWAGLMCIWPCACKIWHFVRSLKQKMASHANFCISNMNLSYEGIA